MRPHLVTNYMQSGPSSAESTRSQHVTPRQAVNLGPRHLRMRFSSGLWTSGPEYIGIAAPLIAAMPLMRDSPCLAFQPQRTSIYCSIAAGQQCVFETHLNLKPIDPP